MFQLRSSLSEPVAELDLFDVKRATIMSIVFPGIAVLDLEGQVADGETAIHLMNDAIDERIVIGIAGTHGVRITNG